jgi:hypothetical protein
MKLGSECLQVKMSLPSVSLPPQMRRLLDTVVRLAGGGWMSDSEANLQDCRNAVPDYGPDV